jgi:hypothetical protein
MTDGSLNSLPYRAFGPPKFYAPSVWLEKPTRSVNRLENCPPGLNHLQSLPSPRGPAPKALTTEAFLRAVAGR